MDIQENASWLPSWQSARYQHRYPKGRGKGGGQPQGLLPPPGQCPVRSCGYLIDATRLMCRHDWNLLPKQLRDRVLATWRSGHGAARPEYQRALLEAIAA